MRITAILHPILAILLLAGALAAAPVASAAEPAAAPAPRAIDARPWPRKYSVDGVAFTLYQPELDRWTGNQLAGRLAMSATVSQGDDASAGAAQAPQYGVLWFTARTETDKQAREVTLHDVVVERAKFPTAPADEARYLSLARKVAPVTAQVVSLDLLESQLAITQAASAVKSVPVDNTPPEIVFTYQPSMLVSIDGPAVFKPTRFAGIERLVNSQSLIVRHEGKYYLVYAGHWARSLDLKSGWAPLAQPPEALRDAYNEAIAQKLIPGGGDMPESMQANFKDGSFPAVVVRDRPAELIPFEGDPGFEPIEGTQLQFAVNTPADVFLDGAAQNAWYLLVSGRWFTAASGKGPWTWVAPDKLPADFRKIPGEHPKSAVLASIPGTPEATEALIANAIPQTAAVKASTSFTATIDGEPQWAPIEGTSLRHVRNSDVPLIEVAPSQLYAVRNGVWFLGEAIEGPWQVAKSVPPVIYTIPTSSPLHYVTYVEVYGSSGDVVYVGYTPGYYGTVVNNGVVVYGTGYGCSPWVGTSWYGCPGTYGMGTAFGWTSDSGWGFSFGYGWYDPWYYPGWGAWGYYPYYPYYGGAAIGNVYGRWGNTVIGGTGAAWANPWTGNVGRGFRGGYYNEATGTRGVVRGGSNYNAYTGNLTRAAGGASYNPETGRVSAGRGGSVRNIYSGEGVAAGRGGTINTDTGRVTTVGGVAGVGDNGAGVAGGFRSSGAGGDVAGIGYVRGDGEGNVSSGGVVKVGDDIYAGKDGNVYTRGEDGSWQQVDRPSAEQRPDAAATRELDRQQAARDRGYQRDVAGDRSYDGGANRGSFDRGSYGGDYRGSMGGYRGGGYRGGGYGGGGMRGGGGRRR